MLYCLWSQSACMASMPSRVEPLERKAICLTLEFFPSAVRPSFAPEGHQQSAHKSSGFPSSSCLNTQHSRRFLSICRRIGRRFPFDRLGKRYSVGIFLTQAGRAHRRCCRDGGEAVLKRPPRDRPRDLRQRRRCDVDDNNG